MKFDRPVVFFDTETTGTDAEKDKIIDISFIKKDGIYTTTRSYRFNPGIPIPESSSKIHGILDIDVADSPRFCQSAHEIFNFIKGCDLAGFNSNRFDVPILYNELLRCGIELDYLSVTLVDVGNLFKIMEPRTLTAAVKFYLQKDHDDAHGSLADTEATHDVFFKMLSKYTELPESVSELAKMANYDKPILDIAGKFSTDDEGDYIFNFGKQRGVKVKDNLSYLDWMLFKSDFGHNTTTVGKKIHAEIFALSNLF